GGQALFLAAAKRLREFVESLARRGERLFGRAAFLECPLQRLAGGLVGKLIELGEQRGSLGGGLLCHRDSLLEQGVEPFDRGLESAHAKRRFLRVALVLAQRLAPLG